MRLIAGLDSGNRCYIGKPLRDSEWLIGNVSKVLRPLQGKGFDVTPEDIVTQYLSLSPISLVFLYAESDVEKFFQAEVANKKLLDDYMRADPPVRIQRKRTKGWRMPPNTISVTRPGRWGNPFVGEDCVEKFRDMLYDLHSRQSTDKEFLHMKRIRDTHRDLEGKNLACFCSLDKPCHADVLLKFLNGENK